MAGHLFSPQSNLVILYANGMYGMLASAHNDSQMLLHNIRESKMLMLQKYIYTFLFLSCSLRNQLNIYLALVIHSHFLCGKIVKDFIHYLNFSVMVTSSESTKLLTNRKPVRFSYVSYRYLHMIGANTNDDCCSWWYNSVSATQTLKRSPLLPSQSPARSLATMLFTHYLGQSSFLCPRANFR